MICLAHGTKCVRTANGAGDFCIRASLPIRNAEQGLPAIFLKLSSHQIELKRKFTQLSTKVGIQLHNIGLETF